MEHNGKIPLSPPIEPTKRSSPTVVFKVKAEAVPVEVDPEEETEDCSAYGQKRTRKSIDTRPPAPSLPPAAAAALLPKAPLEFHVFTPPLAKKAAARDFRSISMPDSRSLPPAPPISKQPPLPPSRLSVATGPESLASQDMGKICLLSEPAFPHVFAANGISGEYILSLPSSPSSANSRVHATIGKVTYAPDTLEPIHLGTIFCTSRTSPDEPQSPSFNLETMWTDPTTCIARISLRPPYDAPLPHYENTPVPALGVVFWTTNPPAASRIRPFSVGMGPSEVLGWGDCLMKMYASMFSKITDKDLVTKRLCQLIFERIQFPLYPTHLVCQKPYVAALWIERTREYVRVYAPQLSRRILHDIDAFDCEKTFALLRATATDAYSKPPEAPRSMDGTFVLTYAAIDTWYAQEHYRPTLAVSYLKNGGTVMQVTLVAFDTVQRVFLRQNYSQDYAPNVENVMTLGQPYVIESDIASPGKRSLKSLLSAWSTLCYVVLPGAQHEVLHKEHLFSIIAEP